MGDYLASCFFSSVCRIPYDDAAVFASYLYDLTKTRRHGIIIATLCTA